ncbi:hypothetical protein H9P43_003614 [Blastocladiella emersonii ATCC 22665]|nr:hypothetical protein H9P43_003614 [Blastocladiella emersonii ATCC 22665]
MDDPPPPPTPFHVVTQLSQRERTKLVEAGFTFAEEILAFSVSEPVAKNILATLTAVLAPPPIATAAELLDACSAPESVLPTGFPDLDAVYGGGIPRGSVFEIAAPPGVDDAAVILHLITHTLQTTGYQSRIVVVDAHGTLIRAIQSAVDALPPGTAAAWSSALEVHRAEDLTALVSLLDHLASRPTSPLSSPPDLLIVHQFTSVFDFQDKIARSRLVHVSGAQLRFIAGRGPAVVLGTRVAPRARWMTPARGSVNPWASIAADRVVLHPLAGSAGTQIAVTLVKSTAACGAGHTVPLTATAGAGAGAGVSLSMVHVSSDGVHPASTSTATSAVPMPPSSTDPDWNDDDDAMFMMAAQQLDEM